MPALRGTAIARGSSSNIHRETPAPLPEAADRQSPVAPRRWRRTRPSSADMRWSATSSDRTWCGGSAGNGLGGAPVGTAGGGEPAGQQRLADAFPVITSVAAAASAVNRTGPWLKHPLQIDPCRDQWPGEVTLRRRRGPRAAATCGVVEQPGPTGRCPVALPWPCVRRACQHGRRRSLTDVGPAVGKRERPRIAERQVLPRTRRSTRRRPYR